MSNPYIQPSDETQPTPEPQPAPEWKPSLALVALLVAIAGLFLPGGIDFDKIPDPKPVPPFVEPEPTPTPTPVVDPAKTEGSWVVVVEQTEQRTLEQAKLLRDTQYWQSLEARGLNWRHYDYDAADAAKYRKLADEVGMPAVFVVGGKGELLSKVLAKFPLTTKDATDAKIREVTGR
jgi:hypothetical protein